MFLAAPLNNIRYFLDLEVLVSMELKASLWCLSLCYCALNIRAPFLIIYNQTCIGRKSIPKFIITSLIELHDPYIYNIFRSSMAESSRVDM